MSGIRGFAVKVPEMTRTAYQSHAGESLEYMRI